METKTKRIATVSVVVGLLIGFPAVRVARFGSTPRIVQPVPPIAISEGAAERLAQAIRFPTVSNEDATSFNAEAFRALHQHLEVSFPGVHSHLKREPVATHSLLYTWEGADPSLKPILLMGHLDVVPVEPGSEAEWQQPPFSGQITAGYIWGRGAIDNKSGILGTLEAVELLLASGFRPVRTVYLAYGHDEEVGGEKGAQEIARLLQNRGVELELVLDEGGVIGEGLFPGISSPVALVGIAEKGFVSFELSARGDSGHSSLPPAQSTIGILSRAITRLENIPMEARLEGAARQLFDEIGPRLPFIQRVLFANLWLTYPFVTRKLQENPTTNAMVRTTAALTIFQAGTKDNVLASQARAVVNFRILPGDTVAKVEQYVRQVIDDSRVNIKMASRFSAEPSAISSTDIYSFRTLERSIRTLAPDAVVAPYLVVVVTDSRYYASLSRNIFRFLPLRMTAMDLKLMHGVNERLSVHNYENAIRIYRQIIMELIGKSAT